jgi:hypothetical protein
MPKCGWNSFDVEPKYMREKSDNKEEGGLNRAYPFSYIPRMLGYKRGSDIPKGDITEVKVCYLRLL